MGKVKIVDVRTVEFFEIIINIIKRLLTKYITNIISTVWLAFTVWNNVCTIIDFSKQLKPSWKYHRETYLVGVTLLLWEVFPNWAWDPYRLLGVADLVSIS